jgi:hypothetical protein
MLATRARITTAALLLISAAAFAAGAALERAGTSSDSHATSTPAAVHSETAAGPSTASSEPTSSTTEGPAGESTPGPGEASTAHSSETLFGLNPEAPTLVALGVLVSVALAALVLLHRSRLVGAVVTVSMLAFTALDVREILHQVNESHRGLAAVAATVAVLHLGAALAAAATLRQHLGADSPTLSG